MDWESDLLRALNAPDTPENRAFLSAWQRHEGGHTNNDARFNWLNSTQGTRYPSINRVGVRAYPSYATGIQMTAKTITNGRYPSLLAGLRAGDPYSTPGIERDLSTWVSGSPSGGLDYAGAVLGGSSSSGIRGAASSAAGCATMLLAIVAGVAAVLHHAL